MSWRWPWTRKPELEAPAVERRAAASGFTAEIIAARESYISGRRGVAELTATVQSCASLWEAGLALADVEGTDLLSPRPWLWRPAPARFGAERCSSSATIA